MEALLALVVEDDERVLPSIEDVLCSLGHEYDWVPSQIDAQAKFRGARYDYVLLDLQIPARVGRGGATVDCGLNLLRWLKAHHNGASPPVIIMTGQTGACVDLTRELTESGAREFIAKPFPTHGRTLGTVIRRVVGAASVDRPAAAPADRSATAVAATSAAVTPIERDIIAALAAQPHESMLLVELGAAAGYGRRALSKALDRLAARGLVGRPPGTRRKGVALTAAGLALWTATETGS